MDIDLRVPQTNKIFFDLKEFAIANSEAVEEVLSQRECKHRLTFFTEKESGA
jgi:hypothetical protein